jgi:hypothetical protein
MENYHFIDDLNNVVDNEMNLCYYNIKIYNEANQRIDYKIKNGNSLININQNHNDSSEQYKNDDKKNLSFSLNDLTNRNKQEKTFTSKSSQLPKLIMKNNRTIYNSCNNMKKQYDPLHVEYIPSGKVITINVSMMW